MSRRKAIVYRGAPGLAQAEELTSSRVPSRTVCIPGHDIAAASKAQLVRLPVSATVVRIPWRGDGGPKAGVGVVSAVGMRREAERE